MNKQEKEREVRELHEALRGAPPTFVLEYRGLTVNQVDQLRKKVRGTGSRYRVIKNRLAIRAIGESPLKPLAGHLRGPAAIAWSAKDPAALAKALDAFARDNQGLLVKAGFIDGRLITARDIKVLAELPPREVLVARLIGLLNAPLQRLLGALQAPARGLVRAMDEIAKKKAAAGGEPAAGDATAAT